MRKSIMAPGSMVVHPSPPNVEGFVPDTKPVRYAVLGPVRIEADGAAWVLPPGKPTTLLACLLLRPNTVVSADRLKDAAWGQHVHGNAALHTGIRRLRRMLADHGMREDVVQAEAGGYRILVGEDELDLMRFRNRVAAGRATSDPHAELCLLRDALREWGEPLLSNVGSHALHRDEAPRLLEERLATQERVVDLELSLGRCREVLPDLWELTRAHPDRERFWEQLIEALYRTGRPAEALAECRGVKGHLREHLGIDPGPALQRLELAILRGDEATTPQDRPTPSPVTVREAGPSPLRVPAHAAPLFVGRDELCGDLRSLLVADGVEPATLVLSGAPGIGKTALALHVANLVRDRFPGGQVAVRMTHSDGSPRPASQLATEIAGATDPSRPRLVVLDDVVDADAVAGVAPTGSGDATVVTSRLALFGLLAGRRGSQVRRVGRLDPAESLRFLTDVLGAARVGRDLGAAARLAELCDHYPLALRIASTRVLSRPLLALRDYVAWLAVDPVLRLSLGLNDQHSITSAFGAALHRLDPPLAAAFLDVGRSSTDLAVGPEDVLHRLADAGLLEEDQPGQFRMHALLRRFATGATRPRSGPHPTHGEVA